MQSMLNVAERIENDESVTRLEYFSHRPYASSSFTNNDEIRITIQNADTLTLPGTSFLHLEGRFNKKDGGGAITTSQLTRNFIPYIFQEIRYEINSVEVDRTRNVGITSTIKTYLSNPNYDVNELENAGWFMANPPDADESKNFSICLPLSRLMGFFEDTKKPLVNVKQELIIVRSASDKNSYTAAATNPEEGRVVIDKVVWKMQHVSVSDEQRLQLLKVVSSGTPLQLAYRSWELHEFPLLPQTTRHSWTIKTSTQLETPRYIILAFQTDRKVNFNRDASVFDNCTLTSAKVFLNSEFIPYDDLHVDWEKNKYSLLYDMYARFRRTYYEDSDKSGCMLSPREFKKYAPLVVLDCTHQQESIKASPIDVRLEFETNKNIPDKTTAYALIIHDRELNYSPLTGYVQRQV